MGKTRSIAGQHIARPFPCRTASARVCQRGECADSVTNWHNEGGKGMTSEMVRFQIRPHPLVE